MNLYDDPVKAIVPKEDADIVTIEHITEHHDNIVRSSKVDLSSLNLYISGQSWSVTYYQQVLGNDQNGRVFDLEVDDSQQQYRKINDYGLKVQDPLSHSQDQTTKVFEVTGSAVMLPSIIPNVHDIFLIDIGDSEVGICTVTSTSRLTIYKESGYLINYKLIYVDDTNRTTLDQRTVQTLKYHVTDRHDGAGNTIYLLTDEDVENRIALNLEMDRILRDLDRNRDLRYGAYLIGDEEAYDPYVTAFLNRWGLDGLDPPKEFNCTIDTVVANPVTIWDSLLEGRRLRNMNGKFLFERIDAKMNLPVLGGIQWTTIETLVTLTTEVAENPSTAITGTLWPLLEDGDYVFSSLFYSNTAGKSLIENLVSDYLDGKEVREDYLRELIDDHWTLDDGPRFYMQILLLVLLQAIT